MARTVNCASSWVLRGFSFLSVYCCWLFGKGGGYFIAFLIFML